MYIHVCTEREKEREREINNCDHIRVGNDVIESNQCKNREYHSENLWYVLQ